MTDPFSDNRSISLEFRKRFNYGEVQKLSKRVAEFLSGCRNSRKRNVFFRLPMVPALLRGQSSRDQAQPCLRSTILQSSTADGTISLRWRL